jgi:outer membrane protein OmpA-like peptidoglycan-associated protein
MMGMVTQMKFTWKESLFIAGMTTVLLFGGTNSAYAARPVDQSAYTSVTESLTAREDLGYEVLLRNQLMAMLAPPGGEVLPPPVPQKLLVFFETAKTDLCADAKLIVREAAAEAQRDKPNNVTVIQVTDISGLNARNSHLAEERA